MGSGNLPASPPGVFSFCVAVGECRKPMNNIMKLLVPLVLGAVAGGINFWVMSQMSAKPEETVYSYVLAGEDVPIGEPFSSFERFDSTQKISAAIPWEERDVLAQNLAPRSLKKGDLILRRDLQTRETLELEKDEFGVHFSLQGVDYQPQVIRVGKKVEFVVPVKSPAVGGSGSSVTSQYERVGPFRIVSLGRQLRPSVEGANSRNAVAKTITIAVKKNDKKRLEGDLNRVLDANRAGELREIVVFD